MTLTPDVTDVLKGRIGELRSKWGWFVGLGIVMLIVGVIALGNLLAATVASVYLVGFMMLIAGGFEIAHSFGVKTWGGFFLWLLGGLLYAIAGIIAFNNPLLAAGILTLLLAVSLIAAGARALLDRREALVSQVARAGSSSLRSSPLPAAS